MPSHLDRTTTLWAPTLEWTIDALTLFPEAFDVEATAVFTHHATGHQITTGIFPLVENTWGFRFANSSVGTWTFLTNSHIDALSGHTGKVVIDDDPDAIGSLGHTGHW